MVRVSSLMSGNHHAVQKLPKSAVDIDDAVGLMHAVVVADVSMVMFLVDVGVKVNTLNAAGSTALMYASTNAARNQLILAAGADENVENKRGVAPMTVAVTSYGSTPVLKFLVARGATPEERQFSSARGSNWATASFLFTPLERPVGSLSFRSAERATEGRYSGK